MGRTSIDIDIALDNMLGREFADRINDYLKAHVSEEGAGCLITIYYYLMLGILCWAEALCQREPESSRWKGRACRSQEAAVSRVGAGRWSAGQLQGQS
jgi:hypothetical protein